jgi:hypothetical protein
VKPNSLNRSLPDLPDLPGSLVYAEGASPSTVAHVVAGAKLFQFNAMTSVLGLPETDELEERYSTDW